MKIVGNTRFAGVSEAKGILATIPMDPRPTVLSRNTEPVAAIIALDEYNDYLALKELVRHPKLFDRLRQEATKARTTPLARLRTMSDLESLHEELAARGTA